jgi:hypothetical protein
MNIRFDSVAGLSSDDIELLASANQSIAHLIERRLPTIEVVGRYLDSKLAWKVGTFVEAILYRIVALSQSLALNWNVQNILGCNLSARALMETSALLLDFEHELSRAIAKGDLGEINSLVTNRHFATRDRGGLEVHPDALATNVLTLIDKLNKRLLDNGRHIYDILSESCHPNYLGHHAMYATLDPLTGTTAFSDSKDLEGHRHAIFGCMLLIPIDENCLNRLEVDIDRLAELQRAQGPVE